MRILVVDDKQVIRGSLTKMLISSYHQVDCAVNGLDALEKIKKNDYDLYIIDHLMPLMNGIQLSKNLKSRSQGFQSQNIPIIFMTTQSKEVVYSLPESKFFNDVINKPLNEQTLLDCISKIDNNSLPSSSIAVNE